MKLHVRPQAGSSSPGVCIPWKVQGPDSLQLHLQHYGSYKKRTKMVATRDVSQAQNIAFAVVLCPGPRWGSLHHSPADALLDLRWSLCNGEGVQVEREDRMDGKRGKRGAGRRERTGKGVGLRPPPLQKFPPASMYYREYRSDSGTLWYLQHVLKSLLHLTNLISDKFPPART